VRRAVLKEAVVVEVVPPAPAAFRVVAGLFGKQGRLFRLEVDGAVAVGISFGLVQDVHGYEGMPASPALSRVLAVASVDVTASTGVPDDDANWQRPKMPAEAPDPASSTQPPEPLSGYAGPPRADPPPRDWHPPIVPQPPPPRVMPAQDMDALDEEEGSAKTVTYGVGLVAGAIAVILLCLLCARVIF
jgi:hypothetical protein